MRASPHCRKAGRDQGLGATIWPERIAGPSRALRACDLRGPWQLCGVRAPHFPPGDPPNFLHGVCGSGKQILWGVGGAEARASPELGSVVGVGLEGWRVSERRRAGFGTRLA